MNVLVTGANGQLGNELRIVSRSGAHRFIFADIVEAQGLETLILDITDAAAVHAAVAAHEIDAIVNCAAFTNVDAAETAVETAERLNAEAPGILAREMASCGGLLVHISTDYVFGKEPYNVPCREDQKGTPTGVYGLTKLHGEQQVMASGCKHVILRTAWLYSEFGRNFCKTMLNLTATKPSLKVVFDQVGTPTYALDLAQAIAVILDDYADKGAGAPDYVNAGIYHYSDEGVCSWFDFTRMIAEYSGQTSCDIQPCHSGEFPSPVVRPAYSVLDKTKVKQVFDIRIPYWTDSLKKCINNLMDK